MTPDTTSGSGTAPTPTPKPTTTNKAREAEVETRCSQDATWASYEENTDPELADLNPPTGQHVVQTIGEPVEATD
jgi:hypothetical protein